MKKEKLTIDEFNKIRRHIQATNLINNMLSDNLEIKVIKLLLINTNLK